MANLDNNIIIGRNIKNIRKDLDLTQEDFAEKLNINAQFLSQVETGKAGISIDNAINICNTANCSSIKLFKDLWIYVQLWVHSQVQMLGNWR